MKAEMFDSTHWADCWRVHLPCAVVRVEHLAEAVRIQRQALVKLAAYDGDRVAQELAEAVLEEAHRAVCGGGE